MSVNLEHTAIPVASEPFEYRALSAAAVSSVTFGVLSLLALFDWWLVSIPVIGAAVSAYALWQIRRRPAELTGAPLAVAGLALSLLFFSGSVSRHAYIYATEVPEGYTRISFAQLEHAAGASSATIPEGAAALHGQQVFIKGYVYPTYKQHGIQRFLLVRDSGTCCFGGNPPITDRVQVTLADPKGMTYQTGIHKIAGVFRVRPTQGVEGTIKIDQGVWYHLEEATLR
jgi:hypothetical protein